MEALLTTISLLDQWMKLNNTDPDLWEYIYKYAMGRGRILTEKICANNGYNERYRAMAKA